jgi:aminopeptidase YwaD
MGKDVSRRKRTIVIITGIIAIIIFAGISGYYIAVSSEAATKKYHLIEFNYERAFDDIRTLCGFGPRLTGTDGERRGAEYIKTEFENAGLQDVRIEKYKAILFEVKLAEVAIVTYMPQGRLPNPMISIKEYKHIYDFVLQGYSGSYYWRFFPDDLAIVNLGDGTQEELYEDIEGKAVLIRLDENTPSNAELFPNAWEAGAAAIILQNVKYGKDIGYVPISKMCPKPEEYPSEDYPDIPFFMVSKDIGDYIASNIDDIKIRINFDVIIEERDLHVVLGDIKGCKNPDKYVMLGAHHDTVYNGPGAVDNTVGTATVIELARQLVKYKDQIDYTIRLVTWGGEELGLLGSIYYFEKHRDDVVNNMIMYLNFDMNNVNLNRNNAAPITASDNKSLSTLREIRDLLLTREPHLKRKYDVSVQWDPAPGVDMWVFAENGKPVAGAWGSGSAEYHTYLDTPEHVNPESLQLGGRIFGTYALYLAGM